jgi:hypothetical protein
MSLDVANGVRTTGGSLDQDALTMSVEFTRPFDAPVDDSVTIIANQTMKMWLSWGLLKYGSEMDNTNFIFGAKTQGAGVDMLIPAPPYVERTTKSGSSILGVGTAALASAMAVGLSSVF